MPRSTKIVEEVKPGQTEGCPVQLSECTKRHSQDSQRFITLIMSDSIAWHLPKEWMTNLTVLNNEEWKKKN
jgi:hypothetical protein